VSDAHAADQERLEQVPRVVRDLAVTCGKQVRIEMAGEETDLDETILEAIKGPADHVRATSPTTASRHPRSGVPPRSPPKGASSCTPHEGGHVKTEGVSQCHAF
jgi:two-component system chemotaxis sensor kinase CheA